MKKTHTADLSFIPTAVFYVAPVLYGIGFGLASFFPVLGDHFILPALIVVLPCLLLLSTLISGMRLLSSPPKTWAVIFAVVINFLTTAFALLVDWALMAFPETH